MERKQLFRIILKILFNCDLLILLIVQSVAVDSYLQRPDYIGVQGYIIANDGKVQDCDPQQAYRFKFYDDASTAADVINSFGRLPAVIVIFNLFADVGVSIYTLVKQIKRNLNPQTAIKLTKGLLYMTLFFGPLSFPLSDFDYETCIETHLTPSIMEDLGTYSTLGVTLLINTGSYLLIILVLRFLCGKEQKQGKCIKRITKASKGYMYISIGYYIALSIMFLYLATLGTLNSILTLSFLSVGTVLEGMQLFIQYKELRDLKNDLQDVDSKTPATNEATVQTDKSLQDASDHGMKPGGENKI